MADVARARVAVMAASNLEEEHDGKMLVESGTARSLAQCQGRCSQSFIIVGASGDLAAKKTYPALFALFKRGLIPPHVIIAGYARSQMSDAAFKAKVSTAFPRLVTDADKAVQDAFLARCFYFAGPYDSSESWTCFASILTQKEASCLCKDHQRVFYLAVPPQQFVSVGKSIKACAMCPTSNRIVVEKPFGHDSASSDALSHELSSLFTEDETFRIDHYLGKEMIQNLMILRFANVVFEPLWNRKFIKCIRISFAEDFGVQGRGGYFDQYGILRDVMQNHLLQILSLVAMEPPVSLHAEDVRDEKVKLLRAIRPITINNVVLGQYTAAAEKEVNGVKVKGECGYRENTDVPDDSTTPTYALAVLFVQNERWSGMPFIMSCGKALNEKQVEIRVQFHPPGNALFPELAVNELVVCIQPHEGMYMKMNSKVPGLAVWVSLCFGFLFFFVVCLFPLFWLQMMLKNDEQSLSH